MTQDLSKMRLLVLQNYHGVRVPDGGFQQALSILGAVRRNNLETWYAAIPRRVILRVLSSDTGSETVGSSESDVTRLNASGHVMCLRCGVDDLIDCLHGKVESHEFTLHRHRLASGCI